VTERDPRGLLSAALDAVATRSPDAVAVRTAESELTFAGLRDQAGLLSDRLGALGIGRDGVVAAVGGAVWTHLLLLHACARRGAVWFPIGADLPPDARRGLCDEAGVSHVLFSAHADDAPGTVALGDEHLGLARVGADGQCHPPPAGVAVVLATSGTSGRPKGVWLGASALLANAGAVNERLGFGEGDCWLNCLPLHHVGGLSIAMRALVAGGSLWLEEGFDPRRLRAVLHNRRITHLSLVPAMLHRLLDVTPSPPSDLRVALVGGAPLSLSLAARAIDAGWPIHLSYGMTETASQVACSRLTEPAEVPPLQLLDGVVCQSEATGPLRIAAPWLMAGYANRAGTGGEGLNPDGSFTSGDLGDLDIDGRVRVLGRADEVLISGGQKVHPGQIERALMACPYVDEVCVAGRSDPLWGERVYAVYTGSADENELERWCRDTLSGAHRPRGFLRLDELPRLANGKPDRRAVRERIGALASGVSE